MGASIDLACSEVRRMRAELSRLIEPGDLLGALTVQVLGPLAAHRLITSEAAPPDADQQAVSAAAEAAGLTKPQRQLAEGLQRWRTRLGQIDQGRMISSLHRLGGGVLVPEDPMWPAQLNDLGAAAPLCLWFRMAPGSEDPYADLTQRLPGIPRSVAIVGSREMTDYGGRFAWENARQLAEHGITVISGGAYGIDAAAHRGALAAKDPGDAPTVAVLAGGVDRLYPAGNESLLRSVLTHGVVLSETAPGSAPMKSRFLQRNRLIAALAAATVVVEARWRSGALSTAHHALGIGRPVGAVPGSVYSASSAGCHRLLRETPAQLVTDAADAVQLMVEPAPGKTGEAIEFSHHHGPKPELAEQLSLPLADQEPETRDQHPEDRLNDLELRVYDALPVRRLTTPGKLAEVAGLPISQVLSTLTKLQRKALVRSNKGQWGRSL
ncbi:DNA-processing protein DprA [Nesterenkonia ebinurensis]|uniref:DNA-processing protein DprA n=1 Tax=Nesterenkonia ebinurensis TaxID=2608252 RepID=UPI001CC7191A|nr:DNA-processing protein DprA [Nesterenkonia ebinurensis]